MIDIERLKRMHGALVFAFEANLPEDARMEMHAAFAELIACRQRIDAAIAECADIERETAGVVKTIPDPLDRLTAGAHGHAARRIRAKLEGR